MWSVKDMFYGEAEPVWILKPDDGKKSQPAGNGAQSSGTGGNKSQASGAGNKSQPSGTGNSNARRDTDDYSVLSSIPYYPYYYPDYVPPPRPKMDSSRQGSNYGSNQGSSYGPNQGSNYGSNQGSTYGYNQGSNYGSNQGANYNSNQGSNYGSNQGSNYGSNHGSNQVSKSALSDQNRRETKVVLKVPICCGECVESIEAALYWIKGVKSVNCDTYREKVTVVATTAAPADILMECRKVFRKSRFWTDDD